MRLRGAAFATVVALATCSVAVAASPTTTASCAPAQGHTLASSSLARVYALRGIAYGCAGMPQFRLGRLDHCSECIGPVVVAGALAAYGRTFVGIDTSTSEVVVRSLEDGKRVSANPAITGCRRQLEAGQFVGSLVARPDGDVAWIAVSQSITGARCTQVHSGTQLLDSGRAIAPHSLRLHGSLISWKHGSMTRTARLR